MGRDLVDRLPQLTRAEYRALQTPGRVWAGVAPPCARGDVPRAEPGKRASVMPSSRPFPTEVAIGTSPVATVAEPHVAGGPAKLVNYYAVCWELASACDTHTRAPHPSPVVWGGAGPSRRFRPTSTVSASTSVRGPATSRQRRFSLRYVDRLAVAWTARWMRFEKRPAKRVIPPAWLALAYSTVVAPARAAIQRSWAGSMILSSLMVLTISEPYDSTHPGQSHEFTRAGCRPAYP